VFFGIQIEVPPALNVVEIGHFLAKPFNFFVSPVLDPMFGLDRTFLCQASALEMLCKQGMDFNHLLRHGIRYLSREEEKEIREREINRVEGVRENVLVDEDGQKFLESVKFFPSCHLINSRSQIQKWLDDISDQKYDFCNVSVTSSYYKRILHQSLPGMFPNLMIRTSKKHFVQIVENKEATQSAIKSERKTKFEHRINETIGLRKIIELISQYKSILVGHNIFQDLVFIWSQFIGRLPETMKSFCNLISEMFPMYLRKKGVSANNSVYDTKYISSTHPLCRDLKVPDWWSGPPTSLETLALWARESNPDSHFCLCQSYPLFFNSSASSSTCPICCT
jgi:poly(A)-specific ribonuclease